MIRTICPFVSDWTHVMLGPFSSNQGSQKSHKNHKHQVSINHQSIKARIFFVASGTFKNHLHWLMIFFMVSVGGIVTECTSCWSHSAPIKAHKNHTKFYKHQISINHQSMKARIFFVAFKNSELISFYFFCQMDCQKFLKIKICPIFASIAFIGWSMRATLWISGGIYLASVVFIGWSYSSWCL